MSHRGRTSRRGEATMGNRARTEVYGPRESYSPAPRGSMKTTLVTTLLCLLLAPTAARAQAASPGATSPRVVRDSLPASCTVAYVLDGDTWNCEGGTVVRLLLVNAPERGKYGDLARRALSSLLVVGSTARLEYDARTYTSDGRLLAYVFLPDGRFVNEMLIREGYAFLKPKPPNERYANRLRRAERLARERKVGLWAD